MYNLDTDTGLTNICDPWCVEKPVASEFSIVLSDLADLNASAWQICLYRIYCGVGAPAHSTKPTKLIDFIKYILCFIKIVF